MRVILHIGTEKTGTSTIQEFLRINEAGLRTSGILVPASCYGRNSKSHHKIAAYARRADRPDDLRIGLGIQSIEQFRIEVERDLLKECTEAQCHTVILSSEHCSSRLLYSDEIQIVKNLLSKIGNTEVIVYLRRQDEMWASSYSTAVKNGDSRLISRPNQAANEQLLDYMALCTRWSAIFGPEMLRVRVFDSRVFVDGDLIKDFIAATRLDIEISSLLMPPPQNIGLDAKLLEFLRRFNAHLPYMSRSSDFRPDPRQGNLLELLERLSAQHRHTLRPPWGNELMEELAEGNRFVAQKFLGREDGGLFLPDGPDETPGEGSAELSIEEAFNIFARLWAEKHERGSGRNLVPPDAKMGQAGSKKGD